MCVQRMFAYGRVLTKYLQSTCVPRMLDFGRVMTHDFNRTQEKIFQSPEKKALSDSTIGNSADIASLLAAAEEHEKNLTSKMGTALKRQGGSKVEHSADIASLLASAEQHERNLTSALGGVERQKEVMPAKRDDDASPLASAEGLKQAVTDEVRWGPSARAARTRACVEQKSSLSGA